MNDADKRRLAALIVQAKTAFDSMTPDQQTHSRHEQRINCAAGNVALSWRDPLIGTLPGETLLDTATRLVRDAAGPCPCAKCLEATS